MKLEALKAENDTRALDGVETRTGGKEKSYSMDTLARAHRHH